MTTPIDIAAMRRYVEQNRTPAGIEMWAVEVMALLDRLEAAEAVCHELVKVNAWWDEHRIAVDGAIDNVLDFVPAWQRLAPGPAGPRGRDDHG